MISSLSFANITLALGAVVCSLLSIALFAYFLGLVIIEIKDQIIKRQQWRATPCPKCIYFNNCQELKCAVNPCQVMTKSSINCRDFQPIIGIRVHDYKIKKR